MEGSIRIAGTIGESVVDGPGFRYVIFTQGCPHGCPGCHNPATHDFAGGQEMPLDILLQDIRKNSFVKSVTFSGGEPFCQAGALLKLAEELPGYHLMAYTGYTWEELQELPDPAVQPLLHHLQLLVDGRFIEDERSIELRFRGSKNQRVLDVPASLQAGEAVWYEPYR